MFKLLCLLFITISYAFAIENSIDDQSEIYSLNAVTANDILDTRITLKQTFNTIDDLILQLNSLNNVTARKLNQSAPPAKKVYVFVDNGTLRDVLNQSSKKLGYSWEYSNNQILFNALIPLVLSISPLYSRKQVSQVWSLSPKDRTLRAALNKWCDKSGWQLVWNVNVDYPVTVSWNISNSFESAVNEVLKASQKLETPLWGVMHDSNKVLEVYSPQNGG